MKKPNLFQQMYTEKNEKNNCNNLHKCLKKEVTVDLDNETCIEDVFWNNHALFFFLDGKFSQKSEKCGKNIRKLACLVVKEGLKSDKISEKKCIF